MKRTFFIFIAAVLIPISCAKGGISGATAKEGSSMTKSVQTNENLKSIYFAGGCFWGVEEYFSRIKGVAETTSGYANGKTENPTYKEVCSQTTGHAETIRVDYDPTLVNIQKLTEQFFKIIDPTAVNRQGNDRGVQYRSGVYYTDTVDLPLITEVFNAVQKNYAAPIATELKPLENFYPAEEYHQDYLKKNPGGYCHIDFSSLNDDDNESEITAKKTTVDAALYPKPAAETIKNKLSPEQFAVTQLAGTERAFTGEYWSSTEKGLYVDIVTGEPLFTSSDKFDSGCGWPSFAKPLADEVIIERTDTTHGMNRTEVRSRSGDSHLGHVFDDGPKELGGLRYCINSASLRFIPYDKMKEAGYGDYMSAVK